MFACNISLSLSLSLPISFAYNIHSAGGWRALSYLRSASSNSKRHRSHPTSVLCITMRWKGQWKTIMNVGSVNILSLAWQRSAFKGMTAWQSYSLLLLARNRSSKGRFCFCAKESGTCILHIGVLVALCLAPPAPQVFLVAPLLCSYSTSLTLFKSWHGSALVFAVIVGTCWLSIGEGLGDKFYFIFNHNFVFQRSILQWCSCTVLCYKSSTCLSFTVVRFCVSLSPN